MCFICVNKTKINGPGREDPAHQGRLWNATARGQRASRNTADDIMAWYDDDTTSQHTSPISSEIVGAGRVEELGGGRYVVWLIYRGGGVENG